VLLPATQQNREKDRLYPNIVLPMSKYFAAEMLSKLSKSAAKEPAFIEMMERKNLLWAEDSYSAQI